MMHQESWAGMMMMAEERRNELLRESNHRRLVNCCKKKKAAFHPVAIPEANTIESTAGLSKVTA